MTSLSEKPDIKQPDSPKATKDLEWANRDDIVDTESKPGLLGYFLKKNPSPDFIADVATMYDTVLDPKDVARM